MCKMRSLQLVPTSLLLGHPHRHLTNGADQSQRDVQPEKRKVYGQKAVSSLALCDGGTMAEPTAQPGKIVLLCFMDWAKSGCTRSYVKEGKMYVSWEKYNPSE